MLMHMMLSLGPKSSEGSHFDKVGSLKGKSNDPEQELLLAENLTFESVQ